MVKNRKRGKSVNGIQTWQRGKTGLGGMQVKGVKQVKKENK